MSRISRIARDIMKVADQDAVEVAKKAEAFANKHFPGKWRILELERNNVQFSGTSYIHSKKFGERARLVLHWKHEGRVLERKNIPNLGPVQVIKDPGVTKLDYVSWAVDYGNLGEGKGPSLEDIADEFSAALAKLDGGGPAPAPEQDIYETVTNLAQASLKANKWDDPLDLFEDVMGDLQEEWSDDPDENIEIEEFLMELAHELIPTN